jgi:uncharacterized protein YchJ
MGRFNAAGMVTVRNRLAQAEEQAKRERYVMLHMNDNTWCVMKSNPHQNSSIVKADLTKEEAQAWLRLLKEDE